MTREEVVSLGRAGKPWEFVALGVQVVGANPGDAGVRFLLAANFARLGLVTAAREQLAALPGELQREADVVALAEAMASMPRDEMGAAERVARGRAAAQALRTRGVDVSADVEMWAEEATACECFRALDGNVVRRRAGGRWELLGDHKGLAEKFVRGAGQAFEKPLVLEGVDPPWLLRGVFDATPRRSDGFQVRLRVVQASAMELLDGLSLCEMGDVIASERCEWYVGQRAGEALRERLREQMAYAMVGQTLALPSVRLRAMPAVAQVMAGVDEAQRDLAAALKARAEAKYAGRDKAWWARRFAEAKSGGKALRVLLPTTRYSTFVKHSTADLAAALRRSGCEAKVLMEPDDHTTLSVVAYLREMVEFEPDLVIAINYTRANMNGRADSVSPFPENVPFVCWIQDAMSHLFDPEVGKRQGELDFVIGHVFPELFERFGFDRSRAMSCAVGVDEGKFGSRGEALAAARRQSTYACEIAYVSNHSESPEAQLARLSPVMSGALAPAAEEIAALAGRLVSAAPGANPPEALRIGVHEILRGTLRAEPDARLVDTVMHQFAEPYADRLMRHQTLEWAANIAQRRGWRLKLFGRGWEKNEKFAAFAAGELRHGEELREAYGAAGVQLQVTWHTLVHQRLFECVMAGGFPLCRVNDGEFAQMYQLMLHEATGTRLKECASAWPLIRHRLARFEDNPHLEKWREVWETLGLGERVVHDSSGLRLGLMLHNACFNEGYRWPKGEPEKYSAFCKLGGRAEFLFASEATLEARTAWALEHEAERREMIKRAAARARVGQTYDVIAGEMLGFVAGGLAGG